MKSQFGRLAVTAVAVVSLSGFLTSCASDSPSTENLESASASDHFESDPTGDSVFTDEAGNEMAVGADLSLPSNWPPGVPTPSGSLIAVAVINEQTAVATWAVNEDVFAIQESFRQDLEAAGFSVSAAPGLSNDTIVVLTAQGNDLDVTLSATLGENATDPGELTLVVNPSEQ